MTHRTAAPRGTRALWALGTLLLCVWTGPQAQWLHAQAPLKYDGRAADLFEKADKAFSTSQFIQSLALLRDALERAPNQHTDACLMLKGLAEMRLKRNADALTTLSLLQKEYPDSPYEPDARYHKGILLAQQPEKRDAGLFLLMNLAEDNTQPMLKGDAQRALQQLVYYDLPVEFLAGYYKVCRPSFRDMILEGWTLRLYKLGAFTALEQLLKEREGQDKPLTPRLVQLKAKLESSKPVLQTLSPAAAVEDPFDEPLVRVAVVMPFQHAFEDTLRTPWGQFSYEFWEGLQLALDSLKLPAGPQFEVRTFTYPNESEAILHGLMEGQVKAYEPHIVVGGLYRNAAQILANHAERTQTLTLIPFSPANELVAGRKYTFLLNPSLQQQGMALARVATDTLKLRRFFILSDSTPTSEQLANAFFQGASGRGAVCNKHTLSRNRKLAVRRLSTLAEQIKKAGKVGVYFPTADEGLVTYLLENLRLDSLDISIFGTADWKNFANIQTDQLFTAQPYWVDAYQYRNDTLGEATFRLGYLNRYQMLPTPFAAQGYDVGKLLGWITRTVAPARSLRQALLEMPALDGLNQTIEFRREQVNQQTRIFRLQHHRLMTLDEVLNPPPNEEKPKTGR